MNNLKMGFFEYFKGSNTVLLEGGPIDISQLIERIDKFLISSAEELSVNSFATVSQTHPAKLFIRKSIPEKENGYYWIINVDDWKRIKNMLVLLRPPSHQYFILSTQNTQLLISTGEYGEEWWISAENNPRS